MKVKFYPEKGYSCPWGNGGWPERDETLITVGFLMCAGIPGLIQKLRLLLEGKMDKNGKMVER